MLFTLVNDSHEMDNDGAFYGDPRRCPRHGTVTSDGLGLHDGLCGACELEADNAAEAAAWEALTPAERAAVTATLEAALTAERYTGGDDDLPF